MYIHNGTYNSLTSRRLLAARKNDSLTSQDAVCGAGNASCCNDRLRGRGNLSDATKEEPWSLPGPFYDFSITYTKMQRLMEIRRPKTCTTGRLLTSSPLAANRAQLNSCNSASPVGAGPSSNTCPRCASHLAHRTSVRTIPYWYRDARQRRRPRSACETWPTRPGIKLRLRIK